MLPAKIRSGITAPFNRAMFSQFRATPFLLLTLALILSGLLFVQRDQIPNALSFSGSLPFTNLSKAIRGADGSFAVVFDANKRIARVSATGDLIYLINATGNDPEKGFYFANDITFGPDGALYVASTYIDTASLTVNREAILRFSPQGRLSAVLEVMEHRAQDYVDNIGLIRGLRWTPAGLRFNVTGPEGLHSILLDPAQGRRIAEVITPLPSATTQVIHASLSDDGSQLAFSTGATEIYTAVPGQSPVRRYDGRDLPDDQYSIPSDVHFLNGQLYFSDLGRDAIMRQHADLQVEAVFNGAIAKAAGYPDAYYECKSFQIVDGHLTLPNHGKIVHLRSGAVPQIDTLAAAQGNAVFWLQRIAIWVQLALAAAVAIALLRLMVRSATPEGRRMAKQATLVALMIGVALTIAISMIFNNMNQRLGEESRKNLRGYLAVGKLVVDANAVDRIRHVKHYMNEDYQSVLRQLRQTITREDKLDASTYAGVYKVFGNKLSALAYHDGLRGIFYPYDYQYDQSVYAKVAASKTAYIGEITDNYGDWLIGVAPLINHSGEIVGFLEVGIDRLANHEANRALFSSTLMNLAMVLFVLLFIFFEIGFFSSSVLDQTEPRDDYAWQQYDAGTIRFVSFLSITGVFLSAAFIPLLSKSLAPTVEQIPLNLMISLPMVLETLCGAVIAVLYGYLPVRFGIRSDLVFACLIAATGMVMTALAQDFTGFIIGRVLVGIGAGWLIIALRTYFLIEKDQERKESGIIALTAGIVAGINTGSVAGGLLADQIGTQTVILIQGGLLVLAALAAQGLIRNRLRTRSAHHSSAPARFASWRLLSHRAVWSFFLGIFLPVTACGFFLGFLFPLFAEAQGSSIKEISLAFMLFGAASIYLGPGLTRLTSAWFGARRSLPIGALMMTGALLIFAYFESLAAAYVTVILFGLTESFLFNQGLSYYSSLPEVRRFGEDKAMGVYNVFESGGEALGPLAFGLAASVSLGSGIAVIAAVLGMGAVLFWAVSPDTAEGAP